MVSPSMQKNIPQSSYFAPHPGAISAIWVNSRPSPSPEAALTTYAGGAYEPPRRALDTRRGGLRTA